MNIKASTSLTICAVFCVNMVFASSAHALSQSEKGRLNFAGMCVGMAEEGNKILRSKGKNTNFNMIISAAEQSISALRSKSGAMNEFYGFRDASKAGMADYTDDAKTIMIMNMLQECSSKYGTQ